MAHMVDVDTSTGHVSLLITQQLLSYHSLSTHCQSKFQYNEQIITLWLEHCTERPRLHAFDRMDAREEAWDMGMSTYLARLQVYTEPLLQ